ncbi:MAG: hypothetical protein OEV99_09770 [Nitrospira sp.]|nr:hypothetical protein [Nitrospira sp.]MDH4370123.1 hypothetical protein [Nitrospira sp.]MDH5346913.1 hypothetical protein [Nitrospira sp.]MDH5496508.1 hypothetical protein [Nitrospira sp.]MDH5724048.1 hypothetical protein [Nitrospira sp.]
MKSRIPSNHDREVYEGWTKCLADCLLKQLDNPKLFMDIDVIPGVWTLRRKSKSQY